MKRITGTHVYGLLSCARKVALDLHGDRALRRELRPDEDFVLARGRDHEARVVAALDGWVTVDAGRDFEAGAATTHRLLADGVAGVLQGVLVAPDALGIPDLLRREPGASELGDWHYVVGDVKSSSRARSDQVLQAAFYAELLAGVQGRRGDYVYIVLKDGHEERFPLAPLRPAVDEVLARVRELAADPSAARPFLGPGCDRCRWSPVCEPELTGRRDLSLVAGVTEGLRATLEAVGVSSVDALADAAAERLARQTRLEPVLARRLVRAARACRAGQPEREHRGRAAAREPGCYVHLLFDPFADAVLWLGVGVPRADGGLDVIDRVPDGPLAAWRQFGELIAALPLDAALLHYGPAVPRWFEDAAHGRTSRPRIESRFVDLARRLRGAAVWPGPVFSLADHVRLGLGRDPHRHGRVGEAAARALDGDVAWLTAKGRSDLEDLAALDQRWLAPSGAAEVAGR